MVEDIVRRAYLKIKDEMAGDQDTWDFHERVRLEIIQLIKIRAYNLEDWPWALGPPPNEIRENSQVF